MGRSHRQGIVAALLVLAGSASAQEAEPLVTDRPDFTESALVVAPSRVQLEGGTTVEWGGGPESWTFGEALLRVGVADRLELRLAPGSVVVDDGDADLDDPAVGVKVALAAPPAAPGPRPAAAILLGTAVPGLGDGGEGAWQPGATLALGWDATAEVALGANLGYVRAREAGERFHQAIGSVALGRSLGSRLGGFLEAFGFVPAGPDGDDAAFVDAGLTFLLSPDAQLDLRIGAGVAGEGPDGFIGIGAARRW